MYLSAEWIAIANKAIKETFEQSSVVWQAIPHWDTGDPAQTRVRCDYAHADRAADGELAKPLGGTSLLIGTHTVRFALTMAQALSPSPDALLDAVIARSVQLAHDVDTLVLKAIDAGLPENDIPVHGSINELLGALIDARAKLEKNGYRAPSCLITDTAGLKSLSTLQAGLSDYKPVLAAANINSLHRVDDIPHEAVRQPRGAGESSADDGGEPPAEGQPAESGATTPSAASNQSTASFIPLSSGKYLVLGRRQRIAHGGAAGAAPGEEPVDLAVSVPPSLEIVGEADRGHIELAIRIRFATRLTDEYGVVGVTIS